MLSAKAAELCQEKILLYELEWNNSRLTRVVMMIILTLKNNTQGLPYNLAGIIPALIWHQNKLKCIYNVTERWSAIWAEVTAFTPFSLTHFN